MSEALRKAAQALVDYVEGKDASDGNYPWLDARIEKLKAALAEPEPKPVAWASTSKYVVGGVAEVHLSFNKPQGDWFASVMPLFAAPPRREPLTLNRIIEIFEDCQHGAAVEFVRKMEEAHGIGGKE